MAKNKKKAGAKKVKFPNMPLAQKKGSWKKGQKKRRKAKKNFETSAVSFLKKSIDMQKSFMDGSKKQFEQLYTLMMDWEVDFSATLPDETPEIPLLSEFILMSPKKFAETIQDFQEIANAHFIEQADSIVDFIIQSQQKAVDQMPVSQESDEGQDEDVEEESEEDEELEESDEELEDEEPEEESDEELYEAEEEFEEEESE